MGSRSPTIDAGTIAAVCAQWTIGSSTTGDWMVAFYFRFSFFLKNHVVPRVDCFFIRSPAIDDQMAHYMQTATVVDPGPN